MRSNQPFNVIFAAVLALTIASGGTALYLGNRPNLTEQGDRVLDSAIELWTVGTLTTFGLLSLRAGDDHELDDGEE
ncbi:MAG: hypothetical protein AB4042_21640 [Leptolyngbyaceae cyanobacterium]